MGKENPELQTQDSGGLAEVSWIFLTQLYLSGVQRLAGIH